MGIPNLSRRQLSFLRLYRRLEVELGRAPSLGEIHAAAGDRYASRSGAQAMVKTLVELQLVWPSQWRVGDGKPRQVGGGTTALGRLVLSRQSED